MESPNMPPATVGWIGPWYNRNDILELKKVGEAMKSAGFMLAGVESDGISLPKRATPV